MSDHLPNEIVIEILSRLPVKPLLQFKTVSKLWYSIITSPKFIAIHLKQFTFGAGNNNQHLLKFCDNIFEVHYLLLSDDDDHFFGRNYVELGFPFTSRIRYSRIVGSCNGLICLFDDYFHDDHNVIVWNPCLRKSVTIPFPEKLQFPYTCVFGFGFDMLENVFKVVRIKFKYKKEMVPPVVELYEQGGRAWRRIECPPLTYIPVDFMWSQVFVHDAIHLIMLGHSVTSGLQKLIVAFEMKHERFREIELPHDAGYAPNERPACLSVTLYKDSLAVFSAEQSGIGVCSVWVMTDYAVYESWTKLYDIALSETMSNTLGFRKNGEILVSSAEGKLQLYDLATKTVTGTNIQGISQYSLKVLPFVESLVLLERENDFPDLFYDFF